ncbi:MAG: ATP synthase F1 subunit delta [Clostridia bacterium]|nr:ATP synthase F1 subunit delta [Clostridia bacterium]
MTDVAREYAAALYMLAAENDAKDAYMEALDTVAAAFQSEPAYVELLSSPAISKAERLQAIQNAFRDAIPDEVVSFVMLFCERGHIRLFDACVDAYRDLHREAERLSVAKVTSAVPLDEEEQRRLVEKLETISERRVVLDCAVDPALLGGVIVEIDGKQYDGSLRHRLREIKDVMNE